MKTASKSDRKVDDLQKLFTHSKWVVPIFTLVIIVLIYISKPCSELNAILMLLSVAAACMASGAAIGFLFGIPKAKAIISAPAQGQTSDDVRNYYSDNTNLEEISDWLTKIILGLSLIELKTILNKVTLMAEKVDVAMKATCSYGYQYDYYVLAFGVIVFYFLCGGGLMYLWTRSNLLTVLEERRLKRIEMRNDELRGKLDVAGKKYNEKLTRETTEDDVPAGFKEKVEAEYASPKRNVTNKDDLQQGRWGGKNIVEGLQLLANYKPELGSNGFYGIQLTVSENGKGKGKIGSCVAFFLHDSFPKQIEYVSVRDGKAVFDLVAYEAFVVGAYVEFIKESGEAIYLQLELDLNKVPGFPPDFYWSV